jgi:hypothetical protein
VFSLLVDSPVPPEPLIVEVSGLLPGQGTGSFSPWQPIAKTTPSIERTVVSLSIFMGSAPPWKMREPRESITKTTSVPVWSRSEASTRQMAPNQSKSKPHPGTSPSHWQRCPTTWRLGLFPETQLPAKRASSGGWLEQEMVPDAISVPWQLVPD